MDNMVAQMRNFDGPMVLECAREPEEEDPLPRDASLASSTSGLIFDER